MRRSLYVFVLLAVMLWQTMALGEQGALLKHSDEQAHAALHWQQTEHHHHDDGTVVLDGTAESVQHLLADGAVNFFAIFPSGQSLSDGFRPPPPLLSAAPAIPDPTPARLRRPPRATA